MFPPFDCDTDALPAGDATPVCPSITIVPFAPSPFYTVYDGALVDTTFLVRLLVAFLSQ
jgi:hypothetical protein